MCGIVGYTGNKPAQEIVIESLKKLEYRGYDSSGIALHEGEIVFSKKEGPIANLESVLDSSNSKMAIAHTRWATHGVPSDVNSHPHLSNDGKIAVVHNGTIDNYLDIKSSLENEGFNFLSESDTEVIPNLLSKYYEGDLVKAVSKILDEIEGIYTIAAIHVDNPEQIVSVRNETPLVIGLGNEENYVTDMNWKLAIDTFGETYHFSVLHKDSLFQSFHGNCQMFDSFQRNGRLILCKRDIDEMRKLPEDQWNICTGSLPVYYLFPNIIFMPTNEGAFLVKEYPLENSPHKSVSQISFYFYPHVLEYVENLKKSGMEGSPLEEQYGGFAEVIRDEDYVVAASSHKGLVSGSLDYLTYGKNEPALHHYHNTYREALGLQSLPLIEA